MKKWASGDRPANLNAEYAEFVHGHNQMQKAISDTLLTLADETDNYKNLREGFKGDIDFNGKKYNLRDLAGSQFPTKDKSNSYVALRTAAFDQFRRYIWNVMFIKAGTMTYSYYWVKRSSDLPEPTHTPTQYGRDIHYKDQSYKSTYLRGFNTAFFLTKTFRYWYFEFDGLELPADAAKELFKDDTPEHIINPDGLFNRSYVFEQFHKEKPDFFGYHELRKDIINNGYYDSSDSYFGFDAAAGPFVFTGGDFHMLIQP